MHRPTLALVLLVLIAGTGCTINLARRSPWDIQQLQELSHEMEQFKALAHLKAEEADELRRAKDLLERRVGSSKVSVGYDARGLVTRLSDTVLFASGKADVRFMAHGILNKVATVIQEVPDQPVGVEGHTDNVPIARSGWEDNKALSYARAASVVDYLVDRHGIDPSRLTAIGYGEARPIVSNDTPEGRKKNRRVEIIILPKASGESYAAEAEREAVGIRYSK